MLSTPALLAVTLVAAGEAAVNETPFLRLYAETRRFMAGRPASARLAPDGDSALFLRSPPRSAVQSLFETDLATGETRELASPQGVLGGSEAMPSTAERAALERQRITARGFTHFEASRDGRMVVLGLSGRLWAVDRRTGRARPLPAREGALSPRLSPDGKALAYVHDGDLHVLDLATGKERRATRGASRWVTHGLAEFVAQEEMDRFDGFWWSPDGRLVAYEEADATAVEKLTVADPAYPERPPSVLAYPRAGRENARVRLGVVAARGGRTTWVRWDADRYPYLATVRWDRGGPLTLLVQNRAQTEEALLAADPSTGRTRTLLVERDEAWLNLRQEFPRWLDDGSGFLWFTERNGGPEVELRGARGDFRGTWVAVEAGFVDLVGYDDRGGWLYYAATAGDPTGERLFRVRAGQVAEPVSAGEEGPAHRRARLSEGGSTLLVTVATERRLPETAAFRVDGERLATLPSVAIEPAVSTTAEIRKVGPREGLYATVVRPRGMVPGKKLPVVVSVYGGPIELDRDPHGATRSLRLVDQWLADRGFIVVSADGRGTPRRGRAFERAVKGDLAGPALEDQVTALRALAAEVPEMDLDRVGIYGWSFGGYLAAMAVLRFPGVFRAAVAGAPVADWADYDTHYTERYLGLPREAPWAYERCSLLSRAAALDRPLLVVHGTADDNVHLLHSLKLSDALFRAGRPHAFLPLSGLTHLVPEPLVVERLEERVARHFEDNL